MYIIIYHWHSVLIEYIATETELHLIHTQIMDISRIKIVAVIYSLSVFNELEALQQYIL